MTDPPKAPEKELSKNIVMDAPFVVDTQFSSRVKQLGDLLTASALIVFTLPLMGLVALAIKCDSPGAVFDRKERMRPRDRPFLALRFRVQEPDGQLTRVGRFLRVTRFDRLPQLINVVHGEMSVLHANLDHPYFLD